MGINFTIDAAHENFVFRSLHAITAVSFPTGVLTIFLLLSKVPKDAGAYKYFLIALQTFSAFSSVHMGVLFAPMPLFPLIGCYCEGILCRMHFPPHYSAVIFWFLMLGCLIGLNLCVFYRHQAVLPLNHPLKIENERLRYLLYSLYAIGMETVCIPVLISDHNSIDNLEKNHPAMMWLVNKESWLVYDDTPSTRFVMYHGTFNLIIAIPLFFCLICHIYVVLNERVSEMSSRTLAYHRGMMRSLVMQSLSWLTICLPIAVLLVSVLSAKLSYEATSVAFLVTQLFPLLNAITVIINSPTLRQSFLAQFRLTSTASTPKISTVLP